MSNYKYYYFESLRAMADSRVPINHKTWVETSYGIYFVRGDTTPTRYVVFTDDEGLTLSTVLDAGSTYWIIGCFPDLDNDIIYWLTYRLWATDDISYKVWKLDITDNSTTDMGATRTGIFPAVPSLTVNCADVFVIGSDLYMAVPNYTGGDYFAKIVKWSAPTTWTEEDSFDYTSATHDVRLSPVTIVGTDAYFNVREEADDGYKLLKFDSVTPAITMIHESSAYTAVSVNVKTILYDNTNILIYILAKVSDGEWYQCSWNISGTTFTEVGKIGSELYHTLPRFNAGIPPYQNERAFDNTKDADNNSNIYVIGTVFIRLLRSQTINRNANILAISDNYVIFDDAQIFKFNDVLGYIIQGLIYHSRNYFPYMKMRFNSDNLTIDTQQFVQIIGHYSAYDAIELYQGTYNFEDDEVGSFPSGWDDNDGADCETTIIASFDGHKNVMELDDQGAGTRCQAEVDFTQGLDTEIEFWFTKSSVGANTIVRIYIREAGSILVYLQWDGDDLEYYDGDFKSIKADFLVANTLTRFRIILNDTTNTFDCYINGVLEGSNLAYLNNSTSGAEEFVIVTDDNDTGYKGYLDALGISIDSDYNIGDNESAIATANQVVFEGIAKVPTKGRIQYVLIENQGSEMENVSPRGSKAGRSDEIIVDINNDGAPDGTTYIQDGTMEQGEAMGTLVLSGAKKYKTVLNDLAEHDVFLWNLRPQGALDYNSANIDSNTDFRVDITTYNDVVTQVKAWTIAKLNQIIVNGAMNTSTGAPYTGQYDDEEDQQANGINSITIEDAQLNSDALCQTKADDIGGNETVRIRAQFKFRKTVYGFIQVGQLITFLYNVPNYFTILEAQFILDKIIMNIKSEVGYAEISSQL